MIMLLKLALITSIIVIGATISTQEGMVFHNVRVWAEKKDKTIFEPLILCYWCMPSIYASLGYLFSYLIGELTKLTLQTVFMYPLVVMLSSFISGFTWSLYLLIDNYIKLSSIKENEE